MNAEQIEYLTRAEGCQKAYTTADLTLRWSVQHAVKAGVPILTLANALGVSRSRIRVLARAAVSQEGRE